ncbi:MAG TPA: hypothetical protein VGJ07_22180 [Rugosimonospora sp.]
MVADVRDTALHRRFAAALFDDIGLDLRDRDFDHFYAADLTSASAVEVGDGHLDVTIWKPGEPERVVRKH